MKLSDKAHSNAQRSCVDDKNQHGMAHNKSLQDEQMREDFSPSSAPGQQGIDLLEDEIEDIDDELFKVFYNVLKSLPGLTPKEENKVDMAILFD